MLQDSAFFISFSMYPVFLLFASLPQRVLPVFHQFWGLGQVVQFCATTTQRVPWPVHGFWSVCSCSCSLVFTPFTIRHRIAVVVFCQSGTKQSLLVPISA